MRRPAPLVRIGAAGLLSVVLMGFCEGVPTDPTQGGLMGGLCGASTGAYRRRIDARTDEIDRLEQASQRLGERVATSRRTADGLAGRTRRLRARVAALSRRIAERSAADESTRLTLAEVERQVAELRTQLVALVDEDRRRVKAGEAIAAGRRQAREERAVAKAARDGMDLQALNAEIDHLQQRARARAGQ